MATRWGIFSAGNISRDFVNSLASLHPEEHCVQAIAARSLESAQTFANLHNIPKAYGCYESLAKDEDVDVIYIGSINTQHFPLAKLAIENGKHLLVEKPLCMNKKEASKLINLAREKKVFMMEAIWSRFFPSYKKLGEELKSGTIGEVKQVIANFCSNIYTKDRIKLKELGGGTVLDIGIYCIQLASYVFGGIKPLKIISGGHLGLEGVDCSSSTTLIYEGGKTATLVTNGQVKLESDAYILGTKGNIRIPYKFWCPTQIETNEIIETFELPISDRTFKNPATVGLCYQAQEVRRCILNGELESPRMPLDETLLFAEIMDSIRNSIGVVYPQDQDEN